MTKKKKESVNARLWRQAQALMPGGVSSPVRAFKAVGGDPLFFVKGRGAEVVDAEGRRFIDYVGAWGPLILGHAPPAVARALRATLAYGWGFGATHPLEIELASLVQDAFPSMERVRFVSSGTEAAMSAVRLARAATRRELIVKFIGCYHGHADGLLVRAGSGVATFGLPDSPGVVKRLAEKTLVLPYNDAEVFKEAMLRHGERIACVLVEPVAGNMGVVPPVPGFLEALRAGTKHYGALLAFDEVITGFRLGWSGAQAVFKIRPDLTLLGKILGGGLPAAAYGGSAHLMERLAPQGAVYQAGTLSGNPLAMAAGIATLSVLRRTRPYQRLARLTERLARGIEAAGRRKGMALTVNRVGSLWTPFFREPPVLSYISASGTNRTLYARFFRGMLARGVSLPPSALEAAFVSTAHTERQIDRTLEAARKVLKAI